MEYDDLAIAIEFIGEARAAKKPWFQYVAFNAPHDPFHDPAPYVTPTGGYSTTGTTDKDYSRVVDSHDVMMFRLRKPAN